MENVNALQDEAILSIKTPFLGSFDLKIVQNICQSRNLRFYLKTPRKKIATLEILQLTLY